MPHTNERAPETTSTSPRPRGRRRGAPVSIPNSTRLAELQQALFNAYESGDTEQVKSARDAWVAEDSRVTGDRKKCAGQSAQRFGSQAVVLGVTEHSLSSWPPHLIQNVPLAIDLSRPYSTESLSKLSGLLYEDVRQRIEEKRPSAHKAFLGREGEVHFDLKPSAEGFDAIKDQIKAEDGEYDSDARIWALPASTAESAMSLVSQHNIMMDPDLARQVRIWAEENTCSDQGPDSPGMSM